LIQERAYAFLAVQQYLVKSFTVDVEHQTIAQRMEIIKSTTNRNFLHKILCLGHEIILNVNWHSPRAYTGNGYTPWLSNAQGALGSAPWALDRRL
jgi:two-component SAPR family response regulator